MAELQFQPAPQASRRRGRLPRLAGDSNPARTRGVHQLPAILTELLGFNAIDVGGGIRVLSPQRPDQHAAQYLLNAETGAWTPLASAAGGPSAPGGDLASLVAAVKGITLEEAHGAMATFLNGSHASEVAQISLVNAPVENSGGQAATRQPRPQLAAKGGVGTAETDTAAANLPPPVVPSQAGVGQENTADTAPLTDRSQPPTPAEIPNGFTLTREGVFVTTTHPKRGPQSTWISGPIRVMSWTQDSQRDAWGLQLVVTDRGGTERELHIPMSLLAAPPRLLCERLSAMGVRVSSTNGHQHELVRYLGAFQPSDRAVMVAQPGWFEDAFVYPDGTTIGAVDSKLVLAGTALFNHGVFVQRGTLVDWNTQVAALCQDNSRLVFSVCTVLTAPMLRPLGEDGGGFHLHGPSSIGKSTALIAAGSVWGLPAKMIMSWRATNNGLEGLAAGRNDLPQLYDEIGEASYETVNHASYMLPAGRGKARSDTRGEARPVAQWRTKILSTGEVSLAEHLRTGGITVRAGQEARLVDIAADAEAGNGIFEDLHGNVNGSAMALQLKRVSDEFYGALGRCWIELLTSGERRAVFDRAHQRLGEIELEFVGADASVSGQVRRVAHRFALVAAVGELAIEHQLLPWPVGHAVWAAKKCFDSWTARRGGTGDLEVVQSVELVRERLLVNGSRRFDWIGSDDGAAVAPPQSGGLRGYKRCLDDGSTQYIAPAPFFKAVICQGVDHLSVARHLRTAGFLRVGNDQRNHQCLRIPGGGIIRAYVISDAILDDTSE